MSDGKKVSDIVDLIVIVTSVIQKTKPFNKNIKNRNKRRKNNANNHHQSQPRNQSQWDRSCLSVPKIRPHLWKAN